MKKINFLLILFSLFIGCSTPNEPTVNAADYFPFKTGNKWYYNTTRSSGPPDSTTINIVWEVTGEVSTSDKKYFVVRATDLIDTTTTNTYYRLKDNTLYAMDRNGERILADFSLKLDETAYWNPELKVVEKSRNIIKFSTRFSADYGYSITFQKGIGITEAISNGFIYHRLKLIRVEF